jgi:hypothetical protein
MTGHRLWQAPPEAAAVRIGWRRQRPARRAIERNEQATAAWMPAGVSA